MRCLCNSTKKPVSVMSYVRRRLGRLERVMSHCRSLPTK